MVLLVNWIYLNYILNEYFILLKMFFLWNWIDICKLINMGDCNLFKDLKERGRVNYFSKLC